MDYIVIGGGSAGCALAGRLSETGACSVLLIEAGGAERNLFKRMPAGSFRLLANPETNWLYKAEADPSIGDRAGFWMAGRGLGGGSMVNGMVYIRGARRDYDAWAASGCAGWSWDEVLPYFLRAENYQGSPSPSHARGGPLPVSRQRTMHPLADAFMRACAQAGVRAVPDYCAGDVDGAFVALATQKNGERWSAARAYVEPALGRKNLTVLTGALADCILFEGDKAVGVRVLVDGQPREFKAAREVVLCAGTLASPAVLMRSGIGPGAHLQAMGIEVRRDVPEVGRNLQELALFPSSRLVNTPTYNSRMSQLDLALHTASYMMFRRGQLAAAPVQAMAFFRSRPELEHPDVKLAFSPLCIDVASQGLHKKPGITIYVGAEPKARGEIRLRSPNAADKPVIDHRLLGHADDLAAIVAGAKRLEQIYEAPALASHVVARNIPAAQPQTDDDWEAQIRTFSSTGFQPIGTCRMGGDAGSVVDANLSVRGVRGLRVVDASIMPMMPSANTNAPTIMIAERAADLIRRDA